MKKAKKKDLKQLKEKKEKKKLKKQWQKNLEKLMQDKLILQHKLSEFLADKEEMEEYQPLRMVRDCLESFHYTSHNHSNNFWDDFNFVSVIEDYNFSSLDLDTKLGIGIGLGIMYSILFLSIPSDLYIPDELMGNINDFRVHLASFISQRES